MSKLLLILLVLALSASVAWLVTRPAAPKPFSDDYHRALDKHPGSDAAIDTGVDTFARVYGDLTDPEIGARVTALYADPMYFNDSLKTFRSRQALASYMEATAEMLDDSSVEIDQILRDGNDVFVRWTMTFVSSTMGRQIKSESIGMTHLRFDADGRIVVHQDFWDSAAGLYRNLPVVGYVLDRLDRRMDK